MPKNDLLLQGAYQSVLELTAHALFGAPLPALSDADFSEILRIAREQAMVGVVGEGLASLPEDAVPLHVMQEWQRHTVAVIRKNQLLLAEQTGLLELCLQHAIPVVILKGFSVACEYPTPDLRAAGDVDCLVPRERLAELCALLEQKGYVREQGLDEHHVAYLHNGVMLELHFKLPGLPEGTPAGERLCAALSDIFEKAQTAELEGNRFFAPAPRHQALILLLHIAKHLRDGGVGLRQVTDFAVFAAKHPEVFDDTLLTLLREGGLFRFAAALALGCVRHLGLPAACVPWASEAKAQIADALFADFLAAANFGCGEAEYAGSGMAHKGRRRGEHVLLSALRGVADMCRREWPASRKCGILLVFLVPFWILRRLFDRSKPRVRPVKMLRSAKKRAAFYDTLGFFEPQEACDEPSH